MQDDATQTTLYDPAFEHDACGIGAVVNISGRQEHNIVELGRQVLVNLQHRGAAGCDESTGDGAGILTQIPDEFFRAKRTRLGFDLPPPGHYGVAMCFLPHDPSARRHYEQTLEQAVEHRKLKVLGWRDVPCRNECLGEVARSAEPVVRQLFIGSAGQSGDGFERSLYLARKRAERGVGDRAPDTQRPVTDPHFYICSMSSRTIVYKGMFLAPQLFAYYPDLSDDLFSSCLALVHQRYSTNTFPSWKLAQPFRAVAHNGEINTLSGNINRMRGREQKMSSPLFDPDQADLFPVIAPGGSDSAAFDNVVELLVQAGRSLPHAMMMMIPEAFGASYHISTDTRAFYEYHTTIMEPWDGPAAMVFTDGRLVGGTLDRNGLRPCRYVVTRDGLVILASEVGVVDLPPEQVVQKGRLQPGRMFLVDTVEGRIVTDNEIKSKIARLKPYRRWLETNRIELRGLFQPAPPAEPDPETINQRLRAFGYTREELSMVLAPMAANAQEPVGSMGNDTPLAVLSDQPKLLFNYFKQLFAQVTNPPIDPLREGLVMSLMSYTGREGNLLEESPEHCRQLKLAHPVLTGDDIQRLRSVKRGDYKTATIAALFDADESDPGAALRRGLDEMLEAAEQAVRDGASLLIVSDRQMSDVRAPIPALLACAALHHGLIRRKLRAQTGICIESGEVREVMHFCLLIGYGSKAIHPYMAFDAIAQMRSRGDLPGDVEPEELIDNYINAVKKGILKTMSKMGISTMRSYHGAQLFEAIGLNRELVDEFFRGTSSRIEGVGLAEIARETLARHKAAFGRRRPGELPLDFGGEYHFRADGESHLWNPTTVAKLQHAVRNNDPAAYAEYAAAINDQSRKLCTLRGLFEFAGPDGSPGTCGSGLGQAPNHRFGMTEPPVPLDEVEPASEIVKRFCTGAMSHGSISKEVHETIAVAMNRLGGASNTGEGGEDPERYEKGIGDRVSGIGGGDPQTLPDNRSPVPDPHSFRDSKNSAIKQVASARFGVTIHYLANAKEIQIKMAQGAKPGEGGQLPGHKVTDEIARLRFATPGVTLISPPPHHDIYSIEDLAQLIYDLKAANPEAQISVKLVSEVGVGTVAAGVAKGYADEVLISGHDGGTGASPLSSIKHAGTPWELGLAETQQVLVMNSLRDRIRVQVDGQMKTGRDIVIAALLGGERFGFGTAALVTMGCILMRKCHVGTCPVGVATQDPELRKRFAGRPEHLQRFMLFVAEEVRQIMASLGFRKFEEMIGRVDRLTTRKAVEHYKAKGLDFSAVFARPGLAAGPQARASEFTTRRTRSQPDRLVDHLDWQIIEQARPAIENRQRVSLEMPIRNVHRAVGTILSNRIASRHGAAGLPDDTIRLKFIGSAGQSFGAFLAPGVTLHLVGDANDYLGKGLSGGRIIVETPDGSPFEARENIIVGNTLLYGATSGETFINGLAGERFAVRNSGATAIVEGVGDHGCEYMTGGTVVVLGRTGRNFAAGMSGGIAYVLDERQLFDTVCNLDLVDLESVWHQADRKLLGELIHRHFEWTGSKQAKRILDGWAEMVGRFVKVIPVDYRKAMERLRERELRETDQTAATEEVF